MVSELDRRIAQAVADMTANDGPLPLTNFTLPCGVPVPMVASAPPTLNAYFEHFCARHGDADFVVDGNERISFADAYTAAVEVARALVSSFGIEKGDRVGIAMRNVPSWIILYMGTLMAGGVITLLNGWWQGPELFDGIADVEAKLVFADAPRAKRIRQSGRDPVCEIVLLDVDLPIAKALEPLLSRRGGPAVLPEVGPDDLATILFTSGSTGRSKVAFSTHRAVVQATYSYLSTAMMLLRFGMRGWQGQAGSPATCAVDDGAVVPRDWRSADAARQFRDRTKGRADAEMGCAGGDASDRARTGDEFPWRPTDELGTAEPSRPREP